MHADGDTTCLCSRTWRHSVPPCTQMEAQRASVRMHGGANRENDGVYTQLTLLPLPELIGAKLDDKEIERIGVHEDGDGHRLYSIGQPRRHLLTTGWSIFVSQKNLVLGNAILFLRGEGGELRLGIRRAARPRNGLPDSVFCSPRQWIHLKWAIIEQYFSSYLLNRGSWRLENFFGGFLLWDLFMKDEMPINHIQAIGLQVAKVILHKETYQQRGSGYCNGVPENSNASPDYKPKLLITLEEIGSPVDFELPEWLNKWKSTPYSFIKQNIYLSKRNKRRLEDDGIFCSCSSSDGSSGVCGRDCLCGEYINRLVLRFKYLQWIDLNSVEESTTTSSKWVEDEIPGKQITNNRESHNKRNKWTLLQDVDKLKKKQGMKEMFKKTLNSSIDGYLELLGLRLSSFRSALAFMKKGENM
ncbi:unnamed protein product [Fraxinus pennsylvanica]|uniref:TF-B3 domain-containing protein n=1 Tax=Fraxinus pennsylvanica TaxID=56036 RepID=A0AAD2DYW3_9LAMI|nr:unnamed protein product [Fraxinus pennsylvanica]